MSMTKHYLEIGISTNARLSDLRPKNMKQLFGHHIVYLVRKGHILHLLFGVSDWAETAARFGGVMAEWQPHVHGGRWVDPVHNDSIISLKELYSLIGNSEVCMLGKDCHKHK